MVLRIASVSAVVMFVLAACAPRPTQECGDICGRLRSCGFLPSILGASSEAGPFGGLDSFDDCEERCQLSSGIQEYNEVRDCTGASNCSAVASCLHSTFPNSPVTGVSRVVLISSSWMGGPLDGGVIAGCSVDAGALLSFVRAFVEEWGTRQYSEQIACELPVQEAFENVPAAKAVHVGFQIQQDGTCVEFGTKVDVPAGQDPFMVGVNLNTTVPSQCAPDTPSAPDGGALEGGGVVDP